LPKQNSPPEENLLVDADGVKYFPLGNYGSQLKSDDYISDQVSSEAKGKRLRSPVVVERDQTTITCLRYGVRPRGRG
jgi:hypothetical protein